MQISDEQVELAARKVATAHYAKRFDKPEDDPHVQMNVDANWHIFADDARIALSALSLPVQPVAWMRRWAFDGIDVMAIKKPKDRPAGWQMYATTVNKCFANDVPLYTTPPVPPTKGPEDDLRAALELAFDKVKLWPEKRMPGVDISILGEGFTDLLHLRNLVGELLALRSRPASALPVVEIDRFNGIIEHIENRCLAADGPVTPTMSEISDSELAEVWQLLQNIRSALIPSVQP